MGESRGVTGKEREAAEERAINRGSSRVSRGGRRSRRRAPCEMKSMVRHSNKQDRRVGEMDSLFLLLALARLLTCALLRTR